MNGSGATTTRRGRVVYRRRPHGFTGRDAARVVRRANRIERFPRDRDSLAKLFQFLLQYNFLFGDQIIGMPITSSPWWGILADKLTGLLISLKLTPTVIANTLRSLGMDTKVSQQTLWTIHPDVAYAWRMAVSIFGIQSSSIL